MCYNFNRNRRFHSALQNFILCIPFGRKTSSRRISMKKRAYFLIVAALILVLVCGMFLVACKDKKKDTGKTDPGTTVTEPDYKEVATSDMISQLSKRVENKTQFTVGDGKNFVTDFDLSLSINDNGDKTYNLVGKANVNANTYDTGIYLALTQSEGGNTSTLFGLGYEDGQSPVLYANVDNGGYAKIKGFSIKDTVDVVNQGGGVNVTLPAGAKAIINTISGLAKNPVNILNLISAFNGTAEKGMVSKDGNTYIFTFNLPALLDFANKALEDAKISADVQNTVVSIVKNIEGFESVTDIGSAISTLSGMLKDFNVTMQLEMNSDNDMTRLSFNAEKAQTDGETQTNKKYTLSLNKLRIDTGAPILNVFEGSGIEALEDKEAQNLLKFSARGSVLGYAESDLTTPNRYYSVDINADIDPFVLTQLINKTGGEEAKAFITETVKKLGYFDITVNETDAQGTFIRNILTLHSKTSDGVLVATLSTHKALGQVSIGIGGVYNIDELANVIDLLVQKSQAKPDNPPSGETGEGDQSSEKPSVNVGDIIKNILGGIKADNVSANGVTVNVKDIAASVITALTGTTPDATVSGAINGVLGSDVLNFKLGNIEYGKCNEKSLADIRADIRTSSNMFGDSSVSNDIITEITSLGLENKQIAQGDTDLYAYMERANAGYDIYKMKGKNLKGEEVTTSGFIFRTQGFDPSVVGKQNVKFYVAIANDFVEAYSTIKNLAKLETDIDPLVPLYGVLTFETEIEVVDASATGGANATFASGFADGTLTLKNGKSLAEIGDGVMMFTIDGEMFPMVIVWDGSKLVVKDGVMGTVNEKFTVNSVSLTSDIMPVPIDIATGLAQDPTSVVVGQGAAWQGFWFTSGSITLDLTYDGKPVSFNGSTTNTFRYAVQ